MKKRFNERQKEAIAKNLDNIGNALVIAILVGVFVESKITWLNGMTLGIAAMYCFVGAVFLRK